MGLFIIEKNHGIVNRERQIYIFTLFGLCHDSHMWCLSIKKIIFPLNKVAVPNCCLYATAVPSWHQHYNFFPCWSRQSGPPLGEPVMMFCKEVRGWTASTLSHESERPLASGTSAPTHRRGERSGTASSLSQVPGWIISSVLKHHVLYSNSRMNKHHFGKMMCHPHTRLSVKASVLQNAIQK